MFPVETFFGKNALIDFVVRANPLVQLINFYRWVLIGADLNIGLSALALIESFAILWFGFRFFGSLNISTAKHDFSLRQS